MSLFILVPNQRITSSRRNLSARRKLALIIGNDNYHRSSNKLQNSVKAAEELRDLLEKMDFTVVLKTNTSNGSQMMSEVKDFNDTCKIQDGDLILFYYSGHGFQFENKNYLIPVNDSIIDSDGDGKDVGTDAARILERLRENKPRSAIIFILDCCRSYMLQRTPPESCK